MTWILLFVAGIFEIGFALGVKYSEGFTRLWPTLGMVAAGGLSFYLLSLSMRSLPAGTAYASGPASARREPPSWASCSSGSRGTFSG
jgi:multidrug transporter EmrE-like cation transporter